MYLVGGAVIYLCGHVFFSEARSNKPSLERLLGALAFGATGGVMYACGAMYANRTLQSRAYNHERHSRQQ